MEIASVAPWLFMHPHTPSSTFYCKLSHGVMVHGACLARKPCLPLEKWLVYAPSCGFRSTPDDTASSFLHLPPFAARHSLFLLLDAGWQSCSDTGESLSLLAAPPDRRKASAAKRRHLRVARRSTVGEGTRADAFDRRTSQKPTDELYKNFKASFPQFNQGAIGTTAPTQIATSLADALDVSVNQRYV